MTNEKTRTQLYERMFTEQAQYRDWLLGQTAEAVLNHAHEYSVREDILMAIEDGDLPEYQIRALLKSRTPLADVYKQWNKTETHHMDDVQSAIEARADAVLREAKEKSQREAR